MSEDNEYIWNGNVSSGVSPRSLTPVDNSVGDSQDHKDLNGQSPTGVFSTTDSQNTAVGEETQELADFSESGVEAPTIITAMCEVKFHKGYWNNKRRDQKASAQVKKANGLSIGDKDLDTRKTLLPNCAPLKEAISIANAAQNLFYKKTYPWTRGGAFVIPNVELPDLIQRITDSQHRFYAKRDEFIDAYDDAVIDEQVRLQGSIDTLFNPDDYPPKEELEDLFYIEFEVDEIKPDFRTQLADKNQEVVEDFFKDQHRKRMQRFSSAVVQDMGKHLKHLVDSIDYRGESRKSNPDFKKFQESTVDNVTRMIEVLDRYNLVGDPKWAEARNKLYNAITGRGVTAGMLKDNESLRVETKRPGEEVLSALPSLSQ